MHNVCAFIRVGHTCAHVHMNMEAQGWHRSLPWLLYTVFTEAGSQDGGQSSPPQLIPQPACPRDPILPLSDGWQHFWLPRITSPALVCRLLPSCPLTCTGHEVGLNIHHMVYSFIPILVKTLPSYVRKHTGNHRQPRWLVHSVRVLPGSPRIRWSSLVVLLFVCFFVCLHYFSFLVVLGIEPRTCAC